MMCSKFGLMISAMKFMLYGYPVLTDQATGFNRLVKMSGVRATEKPQPKGIKQAPQGD